MRFSQLVNLGLCILQLCENDVLQSVDCPGDFSLNFICAMGAHHTGGSNGWFVVGSARKASFTKSSANDHR